MHRCWTIKLVRGLIWSSGHSHITQLPLLHFPWRFPDPDSRTFPLWVFRGSTEEQWLPRAPLSPPWLTGFYICIQKGGELFVSEILFHSMLRRGVARFSEGLLDGIWIAKAALLTNPCSSINSTLRRLGCLKFQLVCAIISDRGLSRFRVNCYKTEEPRNRGTWWLVLLSQGRITFLISMIRKGCEVGVGEGEGGSKLATRTNAALAHVPLAGIPI